MNFKFCIDISTKYLYNNEYVNSCPENYDPDSTRKCRNCALEGLFPYYIDGNSNILSCVEQCPSNALIYENKCLGTCKDGFSIQYSIRDNYFTCVKCQNYYYSFEYIEIKESDELPIIITQEQLEQLKYLSFEDNYKVSFCTNNCSKHYTPFVNSTIPSDINRCVDCKTNNQYDKEGKCSATCDLNAFSYNPDTNKCLPLDDRSDQIEANNYFVNINYDNSVLKKSRAMTMDNNNGLNSDSNFSCDLVTPEYCNNRGTCITSISYSQVITLICTCNAGYYGIRCQLEDEEKTELEKYLNLTLTIIDEDSLTARDYFNFNTYSFLKKIYWAIHDVKEAINKDNIRKFLSIAKKQMTAVKELKDDGVNVSSSQMIEYNIDIITIVDMSLSILSSEVM